MFREYTRFFRNYQKVTHLRPLYFILILITAILYRLAALLLPFFAALIINNLTIKDVESTYFYLITFAATLAVYFLILHAHYSICGIAISDCYDYLQARLLDKLMTVDADFLHEIDQGQIINSAHDYLDEITSASSEIANFIATAVQVLVACIVIGFYSFPILLLMLLFLIIFFVLNQYLDRRFDFYHRKTTAHDNTYSTIITQALGGLQELKSFNILAKFQNRTDILERKFDADYTHQTRFALLKNNDLLAVQYLLQFVTYLILILMAFQAEVTIGAIVMIITYQSQLFSCAREFNKLASDIRDTQSDIDNLNDILDYKPAHELQTGQLDLDDISGKVELEHIYFRNDRVALKDINFTLHPRQFTAIVGPPKSGKSELFDLILRLEKPTRGQIKIDGINIKKFSDAVYAENVAVADQAPFLFDLSIRRNLSFVDPDVEHQIEACKTVGIHDFIISLPAGYQTILHKNAHNISASQRQLISLARTLLSRAEILLFDATAATFDAKTTDQFLKTLKKLKTDHTVVMITRRPEFMQVADRVIVINDGRIIDSGTPTRLAKRCKIYRELSTTSTISPETPENPPNDQPPAKQPLKEIPEDV